MGQVGLFGLSGGEALSEVLLALDELPLDRIQVGAALVEHVDRRASAPLDAATQALAHALGGPVVFFVCGGGVGIGHGGCL